MTISAAKRKGANAVWVVEDVMRKVELLKGRIVPHDVEVTITRNYGQTAEEKSNDSGRSPGDRPGRGVPGVPAGAGQVAEHGEVLCAGAGVVVDLPSVFGLAWDELALAEVGGFLAWLRSGDGPQVVSIGPRLARFAEGTIGTRLQAVTSCYRFHELNGVARRRSGAGGARGPGGL